MKEIKAKDWQKEMWIMIDQGFILKMDNEGILWWVYRG